MPLISVVNPIYQAEQLVDTLVTRVVIELSKITEDFEIILVEDGSADDSMLLICIQYNDRIPLL